MHRIALALGGLALVGVVLPRYLWFGARRRLPGATVAALDLEGGPRLAYRHLRGGRPRPGRRLVILAHGLLKSGSLPSLVALAQRLGERFDVLTFDLPGHGASGGAATLDWERAGACVEAMARLGRSLGYERVGVVGYALGAGAAILAAAQGAPVDALVSVSAPAAPDGYRDFHPFVVRALRGWARLMGTRLAPGAAGWSGPWPAEVVASVAPRPLLVVHNRLDTVVSRAASESLYALARPPKDYYAAIGLHASPRASADVVIAWLDAHLG
ncbi:MAG: alpha/beta fold hydrolase [Chloroflexota bacterium]